MIFTNRSAFHVYAFSVAMLLAYVPCRGQDRAEIDKMFAWATSSTPGCAVAVGLDGELVVNRAYGLADLERDVPITPDTVFDAGSLVKQFVAAATLLLVEDGRFTLSHDVRQLIPELPDYGRTITIDHLLTHTSGLRDWTGISMLAEHKTDALTMILRQRGLSFAPGEEWSYSNSGYVLLKEVVARVSGVSFAEFTQERLFEPLGMHSTRYVNNLRAVVRNRALAYEKEGGAWEMAMLLDDDRGGGGALLTTASDLIVWNEALARGELGSFVSEKIQEPARLNNGRVLSYARGLFIDTTPAGDKFFWHGGSADGYKSVLGRFPEHNLSIAIMCNAGEGTDRVGFAKQIFDLFVPPPADGQAEEPAPPLAVEGVDAATLDLNAKAGLYFDSATGDALRLIVQEGRLRVAGGPPLVAQSSDRFRRWRASLEFMSADEFELQFVGADEFDLKSMEGKVTRYRRARPFKPDADTLQSFAGRYASDEIGAAFLIEPGPGGLTVRLAHAPEKKLDFKPIDVDTFQWNRMMVRFGRDEGGKVARLEYSNPVLRRVPFARTER